MFFGYVQPLVAEYGLYAVFVIVMLESAGVPMPGETALVLASIYAGATGDLNIAQVIAVAAAGAIIGDNMGFWVGRHYGMPLLKRYGRLIRRSAAVLFRDDLVGPGRAWRRLRQRSKAAADEHRREAKGDRFH